jgi:hypothetical protein
MNLQKLKDSIELYKTGLKATPFGSDLWKWESQRIFQENWDINAIDFHPMYNQSLKNSTTNRLWHRENFEPKNMMLRFIEMNREFVRDAFSDLFNENKSIDGRINRFVFHCDELLAEFRENNPNARYNSHFHDDNYQIISIYLSFRYPSSYTPYDFEGFKKLMEILGSREVPKVNDTERFFKVMRTINGFLLKDEAIVQVHKERLLEGIHYAGESLLLAEDFYRRLLQMPS